MYNRFFGFKERPFKLVPNPEYLYLSRIHEEVLAHLNYAVGYGEGFVEITGEIGTGKTTLCRVFLENLDENTAAAYIFNPKLDALQLLKAINDEFGIPSDGDSLKELIDRLNTFLLEKKAEGKRVLLLVDEAQNLSADVLEQLRLLSNLETTTSKLLQIILVGQPELGALLESDALRQLNQRITLSCHLIPLTLAETRDYIRHRIHIASHKPGLVFTQGALRAIFNHTGGVPRLINIACDRALLTAFTLGRQRITRRIVKRSVRELEGARRRPRHPVPYRERLVVGLLAVLLLLVSGLVAGQTLLNHNRRLMLPLIVRHKIAPSNPAASPAVAATAAPAPAAETPDVQALALPTPVNAIPPAATAPVAASSPPAARTFEQVLAALDPSASRIAALAAVLKRWQAPLPLTAGIGVMSDHNLFFQIAAQRNGLEALMIKGNVDQIRTFNLPAVLEFPDAAGGRTRFMAVVGLDGGRLRLADDDGLITVEEKDLSEHWNGVAHILWKNFYNYEGTIPTSSSGEAIVSLKVQLKMLGFPIDKMTPAYDLATRSAVESVQSSHGLLVDGMVGPLTKIVLYNEDPALEIPCLTERPKTR